MRSRRANGDYNCRYLSTECSQRVLNKCLERAISASRALPCGSVRRTACATQWWQRYRIMQLDLPTLMVMQSFALACAGAVLLFAWLQNRIVSALALWGFANIIAAAGILSLMLGFTLHQPAWLATRRHPAATPIRLDMEGRADHRLEACTARPCGPRTGSCGSRGWFPGSEASPGRCPSLPAPLYSWLPRRPYGSAEGATGRALAAYRLVGGCTPRPC
jgi:hypothetical protein